MTTAREHLDWCIERAMEYANRGDMAKAWASFGLNVRSHPGTRHIADSPLLDTTMLLQAHRGDGPEEFRRFVTRWRATPGIAGDVNSGDHH